MMNIKFPKNETKIIEKIRTAYLTRDYNTIIDEYDNIINNSEFIYKHFKTGIEILIEVLFKKRDFNKVVICIEDLKKRNLENCKWYFYSLMSLIANEDLYYAKSIINKSQILNDPSIKYYIDDEGADYYRIINLHDDLLYSIGPCLIVINFINDLLEESIKNNVTKEYTIMRFFDLLNLLYESGADEKIIDIFKNCIETIYEIEIA